MQGVYDVPGGEDPRDPRLEAVIGQDPVLDRDPGRLGKLAARLDPDADDDGLRLQNRTVPGDHPLHRALALEAIHRGLGQELDPVVTVEVAIDAPDLGPED